ncbi:hypothetical protein SBY92_000243 [Candida maltosa Xu316]
MKFGQKLQDTNDKYSEFDSSKSFNRINKPDSQNLLGHHHNNSSLELVTNINEDSNSLQGVHEVNLAWRHIKNWLSKYSPDIYNSLQSKCTESDLVDFQKDLNIKLPNCVLQYFKLVDGQYSDYESSGLIFGLKLMSLDEIIIATNNWRRVAAYLNQQLRENYSADITKLPISHANSSQYTKKLSGGPNGISNFGNSEVSSSRTSFDLSLSSNNSTSSSSSSSGTHKQNNPMPKQRSIPPNTIHELLAHPMWIPLVTDEVGNYIGIDLSPASAGNYGQVILFGRDFDFKFKVSDSWGDFLLIFANDLELGNWDIKENVKNNDGDLFIGTEGELVFVDKHGHNDLEIPYLEMLKRRSLKKWIESLANSSDENTQQLLEELKHNESSILSMNSKKFQSIDSFINDNLAIIDGLNEPAAAEKKEEPPAKRHSSSQAKPIVKSPLSQEVTEELEDEDTIPGVDKTLDDIDLK